MSEGKLRTSSYYVEERPRGACIGDFVLLKNFLAEKDKPIWIPLQLLDTLLRGYSQVAFSNNPLSGLLIVIALGATVPKVLAFSAATGFLGLLLSMLLRDPQHLIENGLTIYNPLLIGAVSCSLIPKFYGDVYLARSLGSDKFPCTTWPFTLTELVLLFILIMEDSSGESLTARVMDNATSDARTDDASFIAANVADVNVDWGMVFRGMVVSTSQLFCVDNVATGAVIYLAVLVYSPATAAFSFLGVFIGTLTGLGLGVPHNEVFTGLWGYNCFLTGAALGGTFFVLNIQTAAATLVAIVYTVALQYVLRILFAKIGLPLLTVPFAISTTLFLNLRSTSRNAVFPKPLQLSFPEKQRYDYLKNRRQTVRRNVDDSDEDSAPA
ncbi:hypothetical protein KPH14_006365 [Odynerus spinipes]|uniref:Urea transporter n=1 Tax=Odynerus spinipes TaxID=1348599 RepID=A0AAD9RZW1_9HYME|nr:hypothetical protein KPH14_006365 [Odynerus spinipes]